MKATFTAQNADYVGLDVVDNNGVTHDLTLEKATGEIEYHDQDGYSDDPLERTPSENEYVNQARRYAKYHVYRERGYETLDRVDNPDCLLAAMVAVGRLSSEEVETQFGDLFGQIRSHFDARSVDLPFSDADPDEIVVYRTYLYLQPDPLDFHEQIREAVLDHAGDPGTTLDGDALRDVLAKLETDPEIEAALDYQLETVSDVEYVHNDVHNDEQIQEVDLPLDREPDARVEAIPVDVPDVDALQEHLLHHLACQVRDCYVCMGVEPPAGFRRTGFGKYRCSLYQQSVDFYEPYFDVDATVESWQPG